jgi:ribosomal protein S27AE
MKRPCPTCGASGEVQAGSMTLELGGTTQREANHSHRTCPTCGGARYLNEHDEPYEEARDGNRDV